MARILIIDDDPELADLFQSRLTGQGHDCEVALDGDQGVACIYGATQDFDLILTDLKMRGKSGRDFLEEVGRLIQEVTPVIVISGWPHLVEALGTARQAAFEILTKPVEGKDLLDAVARGLRQRALYVRLREAEDQNQKHQNRITVLLEQKRALFQEVRLDPLTELPNRRRLEEDLDVFNANVERYRTPFAIAFLDVDRFGRFNDEQSYGVGDQVIRAVADSLRASKRRGDSVYRYGGDEFVLVLAHQDEQGALLAVERYRRGLEELACPVEEDGAPARLTLSGGVVAISPEHPFAGMETLDEASRLCKDAKALGGNQIRSAGQADRRAPQGVEG